MIQRLAIYLLLTSVSLHKILVADSFSDLRNLKSFQEKPSCETFTFSDHEVNSTAMKFSQQYDGTLPWGMSAHGNLLYPALCDVGDQSGLYPGYVMQGGVGYSSFNEESVKCSKYRPVDRKFLVLPENASKCDCPYENNSGETEKLYSVIVYTPNHGVVPGYVGEDFREAHYAVFSGTHTQDYEFYVLC